MWRKGQLDRLQINAVSAEEAGIDRGAAAIASGETVTASASNEDR